MKYKKKVQRLKDRQAWWDKQSDSFKRADVKAFSYPNIVSFDSVKISKNELFVACPPGQLNNPEVRPYCVPALCLWYSHSQYVGRRIRGQSV